MALEPSPEVWVHGLLHFSGAKITESSLLNVLKLPRAASTDLPINLDTWAVLAETGLSMSRSQAAACMRFAHVLSQPRGDERDMPTDEALRVPLGSMLLLLWVQWAQHELGENATNLSRSQAASGEVWPSKLQQPNGSADGGAHPNARALAVQSRLQSMQAMRRRRKMLQGSLPTLLQLVAAGAERVYASELDRLGLLMRPDRTAAARLASRGQRADSVSGALGIWSTHPSAALPTMGTVLPAMRGALVEVRPASPAAEAAAAPPSRSPLAPPPPTPLTPSVSASAVAGSLPNMDFLGQPACTPAVLPARPAVLTPDDNEHEQPAVSGTLGAAPEAAEAGPAGSVLRLHASKRRTLVLREAELGGGALQLIDCHSCYVYALAPVRGVELLGCTGCTVVVGAASRVVTVSHCANMKLVATCQALRLSSCTNCTFQLCVNSPPLLMGENHRVHLAPFGTIYDGLPRHMAAARVLPQLHANFWDTPVSSTGPLALGTAAAEHGEKHGEKHGESMAEPACALLPPARFLPFHVPMDIPHTAAQGGGAAPVCELPTEYADALVGHVTRMLRFRDEIAALRCSEAVRSEVQATLHAGFRDWLQRTGNLRQVTDLMAQPTW
jgi:hypothetical protein